MRSAHATKLACLDCRIGLKISGFVPKDFTTRTVEIKCPSCGKDLLRIGNVFKTPRKNNLRQWAKIRALVAGGFYFDSTSVGSTPDTLGEVAGFLRERASAGQKKPLTKPVRKGRTPAKLKGRKW